MGGVEREHEEVLPEREQVTDREEVLPIDVGGDWVAKDGLNVSTKVVHLHWFNDEWWVTYEQIRRWTSGPESRTLRVTSSSTFLSLYVPKSTFFEEGKTYSNKNGDVKYAILAVKALINPAYPPFDRYAFSVASFEDGTEGVFTLDTQDFKRLIEVKD